MRTLLIDGDILVVSTGAALERDVDWGNDEWTLHVDGREYKETVLRQIEGLKDFLEADRAIVCLSRGETFRHRLSPDYKAGRGRKPVGTGFVRDWLIAEHGAVLKPGIEADDVMGIFATHPELIKGEKIIVSQDKDMLTIPGLVYRGGEVIEVSAGEAEFFWMKQTLTGDKTDGYPGCPGIGPVKAEQILNDPEKDLWTAVVRTFEKAKLTEQDALLQARLARILHHTDYDYIKKEPILWQPTVR